MKAFPGYHLFAALTSANYCICLLLIFVQQEALHKLYRILVQLSPDSHSLNCTLVYFEKKIEDLLLSNIKFQFVTYSCYVNDKIMPELLNLMVTLRHFGQLLTKVMNQLLN